ncbi:hypothetical protein C7M84_014603 [Penaeus vannamei]|uniref:Uncharacterized protein n=1 Tax=Penaeus vannamei TaxID=6689 RepID=A0A3R7MQB7_PENVA|nr:hypothetical protein C7M84_014603 [Penaeus vannamei]
MGTRRRFIVLACLRSPGLPLGEAGGRLQHLDINSSSVLPKPDFLPFLSLSLDRSHLSSVHRRRASDFPASPSFPDVGGGRLLEPLTLLSPSPHSLSSLSYLRVFLLNLLDLVPPMKGLEYSDRSGNRENNKQRARVRARLLFEPEATYCKYCRDDPLSPRVTSPFLMERDVSPNVFYPCVFCSFPSDLRTNFLSPVLASFCAALRTCLPEVRRSLDPLERGSVRDSLVLLTFLQLFLRTFFSSSPTTSFSVLLYFSLLLTHSSSFSCLLIRPFSVSSLSSLVSQSPYLPLSLSPFRSPYSLSVSFLRHLLPSLSGTSFLLPHPVLNLPPDHVLLPSCLPLLRFLSYLGDKFESGLLPLFAFLFSLIFPFDFSVLSSFVLSPLPCPSLSFSTFYLLPAGDLICSTLAIRVTQVLAGGGEPRFPSLGNLLGASGGFLGAGRLARTHGERPGSRVQGFTGSLLAFTSLR